MTTWSERNAAAEAVVERDDLALAEILCERGDAAALIAEIIPTEDIIQAIRDSFDDDIPVCTCDRCDETVLSDCTHMIDDCDTWCDECTNIAAYYWEDDGEYHSEPEPDIDEDTFGRYHSNSRNPANPGDIGIEVELQFHDDASEVCEHARDSNIMLEEDASLNYSNSGEAITHPFKPDRDGLKKLGGLTEFLDAVRASAWSNTGYGIHVNVDRRGLSRFTLARVERFMSRNVHDVYRVAGRVASQWSPVLNRSTRDLGTVTQKYAAMRIASDRIEFRLFQSNAKATGVRSCVRFSLDLIDYCRDAGWDGLVWSQFCEAYPQWASFRTANDVSGMV